MVFDDAVMKARLPRTHTARLKDYRGGNPHELDVANVVANALKDWAVEKGATYTHWFQPTTGITAEKHDSFISPTRTDGLSWSFPAKSLSRVSRMLCFLRRTSRHLEARVTPYGHHILRLH